jgi:hypothetical protein
MSALKNDDARDTARRTYGLQPLEREALPANHPVSVFGGWYDEFRNGHLLPDELVLLAQPGVRQLLRWVRHVEPVEVDGVVDFYVLSQGDELDEASSDHIREGWMSETLDEEFVESRYHEAITASILRKPMFSRGTVPSIQRSFIMQYRGVFPLYAENHARLRLAIIAAETYAAVDQDD